MDESEAERLVAEAVERAGGCRVIVGSPRHPFSMNPTRDEVVEGHTVTIHYSEISSPAIAIVEGWVFEIRDDELVMLSIPRRKPEA
ncbi:MAG TPA: protein-L-isoaspartate o-methyltransferase 1 [Thermomicrobiales bacterium]|nr:protein-L-isoaspartate o-methyltransferase 1 [Thermomicrobiales bacterium]